MMVNCRHNDMKPIGNYRLMVTQAVEVMRYYEDDAEMVVEDRTYPVYIEVYKCPKCGALIQYDALGWLGELDRLPSDFARTAPDPDISP